MFYLPNKRRRCHLDVAQCGEEGLPNLFLATPTSCFSHNTLEGQLLFETQEISDFHNRLVLPFSFL
jgi:hypothetical protein